MLLNLWTDQKCVPTKVAPPVPDYMQGHPALVKEWNSRSWCIQPKDDTKQRIAELDPKNVITIGNINADSGSTTLTSNISSGSAVNINNISALMNLWTDQKCVPTDTAPPVPDYMKGDATAIAAWKAKKWCIQPKDDTKERIASLDPYKVISIGNISAILLI